MDPEINTSLIFFHRNLIVFDWIFSRQITVHFYL